MTALSTRVASLWCNQYALQRYSRDSTIDEARTNDKMYCERSYTRRVKYEEIISERKKTCYVREVGLQWISSCSSARGHCIERSLSALMISRVTRFTRSRSRYIVFFFSLTFLPLFHLFLFIYFFLLFFYLLFFSFRSLPEQSSLREPSSYSFTLRELFFWRNWRV